MIPRVSVLLPVYNGGAWLRECMESVLAQSLTDFELLVADDGSTDASAEIAAGYQDHRIRVFRFSQNIGLFGNLNRILRAASAPLVRCLCQDDLLEPDCLAWEAQALDRHQEVVISVCSASEINEAGVQDFKWGLGNAPKILGSELALESFLYHGCIAGNLSTVCFRRKCAESVGGFDETYRFAGDYQMWTKLCQRGSMIILNRQLIRMRRHRGRLSLARRAGIEFVRENRRIRTDLMMLVKPVIRTYAKRYVSWRQNVLDFHQLVHCLHRAEYSQCHELAKIMGARDLFKGFVVWLITINNHLYRPQPRFTAHAHWLDETKI